MVTVERRRAPRTRLRELVYIGMGTDNGGVVLDVSDGGLSFHAVASVQQDSPIHFSLSVEGRRRVEGFAEVAWNSAAGKCAGLRFTHLPEEVREQIQIWSNQPRLNLPAAGESLQPIETEPAPNGMNDSAPVVASQPVSQATSLSAAMCEQGPSTANVSDASPENLAETVAALPDLGAAEHVVRHTHVNGLSMFPPEPAHESEVDAPARRYTVPSKHGVFAIVLTVILAFMIAIGGLSYAYLHGAGKYLFQLGEKIWGWL